MIFRVTSEAGATTEGTFAFAAGATTDCTSAFVAGETTEHTLAPEAMEGVEAAPFARVSSETERSNASSTFPFSTAALVSKDVGLSEGLQGTGKGKARFHTMNYIKE